MTGRSTPLNEEIRRTPEVTGTVGNNSQIRKRRDPSDAPLMHKSGVRSIIPMDMIWKSVKLFWIIKGCRHQQSRHLRIPVGESIVERSPTVTSIWQKST
jgi:hypothetical protein